MKMAKLSQVVKYRFGTNLYLVEVLGLIGLTSMFGLADQIGYICELVKK